jgi:anti-sigma-K factor RskA
VTRAASHDEAREELGAAALDALSPAERAAVLAHVAACAECRTELAAYAAAAACLADAVQSIPIDPVRRAQVRTRLLARAAADAEGGELRTPNPIADVAVVTPGQAGRPTAAPVIPGTSTSSATPLPRTARGEPTAEARARRRWGAAAWLAAAASLAFVVAAAGLVRASRERDTLRVALRATEARAAARADSLSAVSGALTEKARMLDAITGPSVRVVELTGSGVREPIARMFWDRASNRWTMVAHNLPMPPAGRTYQVWLVTSDAKISAGTFEPSPAGDAMVQAEYALDSSALQAVAVTEEPAGGMPQPTGRMVILGAAPRINR